MKKGIPFLFLLLTTVFSAGAQPSGQDLSFKQLFSISPEVDEPGYLLAPSTLTTDSKGRIFIGDTKRKKVLMYSENGEFRQSFGRAGRGPGEFNRLIDIDINESGQLLALDQMMFKIARFDIPEGYVDEHLFEDLHQINMTSFVSMSADTFAAVYAESPKSKEHIPDHSSIIRLYRFGKGTMISSYLDMFKHRFNIEKPLEMIMGTGLGYHVTALGDRRIAVGHNVYNGELIILDTGNGEVVKTQNKQITSPYYIQYEEDPSENRTQDIPGLVRSFGPTGKFFYKVIYYTKLLQSANNQLFHIYEKYPQEGGESTLHMELYNTDGELLFFRNISEFFSKENVRFQQFLHINSRHRLYVASFFNDRDPRVDVYKISW